MTVKVLQGHVLDVLAREPERQYHAVVTSPPYLWLRAYGTEPQAWPDGWVGELGQEPTPEQYTTHLVAVMEGVRRVLRDDGTLWVNLAGCYYNDPGGQNGGGVSGASGQAGGTAKLRDLQRISDKAREANAATGRRTRGRHGWLKPLDWVDVPGLFARAMQEAGWVWRSDVVWVKPSALPESVGGTRWERCRVKTGGSQRAKETQAYLREATATPQGAWETGGLAGQAEWADCPGCPKCKATDGLVLRKGNGRPTKSTERVLLFIKKPGAYFDVEAVREPHAEKSYTVHTTPRKGTGVESKGEKFNAWLEADPSRGRQLNPAGRNLRDWWVIGPEPLKAEAGESEHYAAYPSALPTRCVKAGTSERGCCPECGAPWARIVSRSVRFEGGSGRAGNTPEGKYQGSEQATSGDYDIRKGPVVESTTHGWRATCSCPAHEPVPCRVLDPFGGSGTTAIAADRLGRDATLVELKPAYADLARRRMTRDAPLLMWDAVTVEGEVEATDSGSGAKPASHPSRTVAGFNERWKAAAG